MWAAAAPLPYYSAYRGSRRKASKDKDKDGPTSAAPASIPESAAVPAPASAPAPPAPAAAAPPAPPAPGSNNITSLLEPAVDGPPSPERIRALSKHMRRASTLDKHQSHHTTSSGSSSLRSLASERPSWDQTLENITLSRRSSGRSTASSMPARERPDSVQLFGRAIFSRKGKLKREGSTHSSSGSSLYSGEAAGDGHSISGHKLPAIFGRRKTTKATPSADDPSISPKKLLISGPYNFQHVTHTRRDHLPDLQRASRMELVSEFSTLRPAHHSRDSSLKGIHADDLHFSDFPSEGVHVQDDVYQVEPHTRIKLDRTPLLPRHAASSSGPRRLVKQRSQEHLRISPPRPPRPPRSPIDPPVSYSAAPPVPPPRLSSRQSIRYDGFDPLATTTLERPQTSGGFRRPQPFSFVPDAVVPPATSHGVPPSGLDAMWDSRFSHAVTTPDDAAWPLTSPTTAAFDLPLPDVPEEDEHYVLSRRSRVSLASNHSSLRASQSAPLLRQLAQSQTGATQRPPSAGSDTLGRFDLFAAQRALKAAEDGKGNEALPRSSWEEDIDYCYEHEAEADFYYEWGRPSMDSCREDNLSTVLCGGADRLGPNSKAAGNLDASPSLLSTPGRFDVPALSPASQASTADPEAITPTAPSMPVTSNFSLPRSDAGFRVHKAPIVRPLSHASSFKESHGFTLSPSLLIPSDYQQQMMLAAREMDVYGDDDTVLIHDAHDPMHDDPTLRMNLVDVKRASIESIGTNSSGHSDPSAGRHVSTTSTSTAFTKLTMSTTADTVASWSPKSDSGAARFRRSRPGSSGKADPREEVTRQQKLKRLSAKGRPRAKTTSLSTPPPPPGQFAFYPPVYAHAVAANRI